MLSLANRRVTTDLTVIFRIRNGPFEVPNVRATFTTYQKLEGASNTKDIIEDSPGTSRRLRSNTS